MRALLIAGLVLSLASVVASAEEPRKSMGELARERMTDPDYDDIVGRPGNGPPVGQIAPDFELMPLKFYEFGIDKEDITIDNADALYKPVRLSDFAGHKPVVLIFGSYT